jgi:hypothetical protein
MILYLQTEKEWVSIESLEDNFNICKADVRQRKI